MASSFVCIVQTFVNGAMDMFFYVIFLHICNKGITANNEFECIFSERGCHRHIASNKYKMAMDHTSHIPARTSA